MLPEQALPTRSREVGLKHGARRQLLAVITFVAASHLSGCIGGAPGDTESAPTPLAPSDTGTPATSDVVTEVADVDQEGQARRDEGPEALLQGLSIQTLDPNRGPSTGGLQVVMTGSDFRVGLEVYFGDLPVLDLFILNQGAALVTIPAHPPGLVDVMIRHFDIEDGAPVIAPDAFMYEAELQITTISPSEGSVSGGEDLIVSGSGYTQDARLFIGGRPALDQEFVDPYTLRGRTPPGNAGPADLHIVTSHGVVSAEEAFLYRSPIAIERISPIRGPASGGTLVSLEGQGLSGDAHVAFGPDDGVILSASNDASRLEVWSPGGEAGAWADITVTTGVDSVTMEGAWRWDDDGVDPYILNCTHAFPLSGPATGATLVELACNGLHYGANV